MKFEDIGKEVIVEETDVLVAGTEKTAIYRDAAGKYHVVDEGVIRHPNSAPEDVMRVLCHYLTSALYRESVLKKSNS